MLRKQTRQIGMRCNHLSCVRRCAVPYAVNVVRHEIELALVSDLVLKVCGSWRSNPVDILLQAYYIETLEIP